MLSLLAVALILGLVPMVSAIAQSTSSRPNNAPSQWINWRGLHYRFLGPGSTPPQCTYCYGPQQMWNAYDLLPVLKAGDTGKGETIAIIDSFGSPTIANDLKSFDQGYGIPDPPSFKVIAPFGTLNYNPSTPDMSGWATETSLDVEWAHAMAPGANILLFTSPVDETQGIQGLPEFLFLEQLAVNVYHANIISQSWATTENNLL